MFCLHSQYAPSVLYCAYSRIQAVATVSVMLSPSICTPPCVTLCPLLHQGRGQCSCSYHREYCASDNVSPSSSTGFHKFPLVSAGSHRFPVGFQVGFQNKRKRPVMELSYFDSAPKKPNHKQIAREKLHTLMQE